jgi:undecaprenyl diphosphate synthase
VRVLLGAVKELTKGLDGMRLTLALSYGSRDELVAAARSLAADVKRGKLSVDDIDVDAISKRLDTAGMPDPDLLIRTSGEMRVSNFMLWQIAYSELYVTPVAWPDFHKDKLDEALESFRKRQRRFGLTGAQASAGAKGSSA